MRLSTSFHQRRSQRGKRLIKNILYTHLLPFCRDVTACVFVSVLLRFRLQLLLPQFPFWLKAPYYQYLRSPLPWLKSVSQLLLMISPNGCCCCFCCQMSVVCCLCCLFVAVLMIFNDDAMLLLLCSSSC